MSTTSTIDAPICRTPLGVEIMTAETGPGRLPGERTPQPRHRPHAREAGEYLFVGLRGATRLPDTDPVSVRLAPGDICFYDAHRPPALDFPERFRATVFLVPADLLGITPADAGRITRTPVARTSRLGALLSPLLSDLARTAAEARPPVGDMLAGNAVNLLATLAAERLGSHATGPHEGQAPPVLARIRQYVELHLPEPDLSPETLARAHHISVRYLHKLFQQEGTTVGRWILRRRLEECRRDLLRHGRRSRTIAAVAGRWGFTSATHFSRVFRTAYGMSPREWRDSAGRV
ncbi:helix-turn-helix domain-containing protein [Streptomyces bobili]|uniref:helix-turn-helix domain-containing protein n=1 Tax=Streptomyces bobili TaxID=67280 RepID=UPI000A3B1998|nr:helix-turn-helix domain-containing protein [Streptomyces bobili]